MPPNINRDPGPSVPRGVSLPDVTEGGSPTSLRVPGPPLQRKLPDQLRVMVAGESGLGKTTFLNNIFRHLNGGENPMDQAAVVQEQFSRCSTTKIEERNFNFQTRGGQDYKFFLVDTPGYGDHLNVSQSFKPVVDYIIAGNKRYLAEVIEGNDAPDQDDRTDVCIYFIAAHRCKPIDIEYMKQLSKAVAVIPVIGKSDSMTLDEMRDFKKVIVDKAAADADGLDFFTFSDQAWDACLAALNIEGQADWLGERQPPPFAVISSKVDDRQEEGISPPDPARRYAWGTCHVMFKGHSDNAYLQCLLLEVGFQEMKSEMRERHQKYRKEVEKKRKESAEQLRKTQARPVKEKIADELKDIVRKAFRNAQPFGAFALALAVAVVAGIAVMEGRFTHPAICPDRVCYIEPFDGLAGWREVIDKIQELEGSDRIVAAADSGEHLDILINVLDKYRNDTEHHGKAQGSTSPSPTAE